MDVFLSPVGTALEQETDVAEKGHGSVTIDD
jgi:hypothetical protein